MLLKTTLNAIIQFIRYGSYIVKKTVVMLHLGPYVIICSKVLIIKTYLSGFLSFHKFYENLPPCRHVVVPSSEGWLRRR